jgi:hypothetical protein
LIAFTSPDASHSTADVRLSMAPWALVEHHFERTEQVFALAYAVPDPTRPIFLQFAAERKIEECGAMQADWDGYGALPISEEAKANSLRALALLLSTTIAAPEITPNPNGTLSLEWETSAGVGHLEIGKTRFSFYIKPAIGGQPVLADGLAEQIDRSIGELIATVLYPARSRADTITRVEFLAGRVRHPY